jgi:hypothetical protein
MPLPAVDVPSSARPTLVVMDVVSAAVFPAPRISGSPVSALTGDACTTAAPNIAPPTVAIRLRNLLRLAFSDIARPSTVVSTG